MLYLALLLLLIAVMLCFGLSRGAATRTLGFVASGAVAAAALTLLLERVITAPFDAATLTWIATDHFSATLAPQLGVGSLALALTLLGGGALALLTLTLALAPAVRGFGGLFAWALLTIVAVLLSLVCSPLLYPLVAALGVLSAYGAARMSGGLNRSETLPQGLALGLVASLLLLLGLLTATSAPDATPMPDPVAAGLVFAGCMMLIGAAPFHSAFDEAVVAPAALGSLLYGLALPILGLGVLFSLVRELPSLPETWRIVLLVSGVMCLFACTAGALASRSLRSLLGWQASGQAGLVLVALGLEGSLAALAAPALTVNLALATLAGSLAVAALEREGGSDDFTEMTAGGNLVTPGLLWATSAASALGLPPFWGFWGRQWLLTGSQEQGHSWLIPLILAASVLAASAYVAPLARFWRSTQQEGQGTPISQMVIFLLALAPLLALGLAPQLAWENWLAAVPGAPLALPVDGVVHSLSIGAGIIGVLVAVGIWRRPWPRQLLRDLDMEPAVLALDALSESLASLAWLGRPVALLQAIWNGLLALSKGAQTAVALFEQRFYLAGVLLAVICVMLLMAQ